MQELDFQLDTQLELANMSAIESLLCAVVRTVAFGVRAAYTVHYRPALEGVWLAFNNAGFGANVATLSLVLGTWYVMTLFRPCRSCFLAQACWCTGGHNRQTLTLTNAHDLVTLKGC